MRKLIIFIKRGGDVVEFLDMIFKKVIMFNIEGGDNKEQSRNNGSKNCKWAANKNDTMDSNCHHDKG